MLNLTDNSSVNVSRIPDQLSIITRWESRSHLKSVSFGGRFVHSTRNEAAYLRCEVMEDRSESVLNKFSSVNAEIEGVRHNGNARKEMHLQINTSTNGKNTKYFLSLLYALHDSHMTGTLDVNNRKILSRRKSEEA